MNDRRLDVLRAIVSQYVHTREPVGSKAIAQSQDLGVSSATIRNDMAVLEEAGLIYQCRPRTNRQGLPSFRRPIGNTEAHECPRAPGGREILGPRRRPR